MRNKSIQHARKNVSGIYPFGNGYKFRTYDKRVNAWREIDTRDYWSARFARSQALIDAAREFLSKTLVQYDGGKWTNYV